MYRKTSIRRVLEYLRDGFSVREIARMLHASRNTISRIQMSAKQSNRSLEELLELENDVLYEMFFPEKFTNSPVYADINYGYVHNELKKTGVTLKLLWEEYCEKCRKESALPCSYSSFTRGYNRNAFLHIAKLGFIESTTNIIVTGPSGSGKTYLACSLGVEACKQGFRTFYIRTTDLLRNFENQRDNLRELKRYQRRISNYPVLIVDEWLSHKLQERDAKWIYELMEMRSGNHPTIFVGQFPSETWHDRLGGGTMADAIMDRIIHNSYPFASSETNLRKIYDEQKLKKLLDSFEG